MSCGGNQETDTTPPNSANGTTVTSNTTDICHLSFYYIYLPLSFPFLSFVQFLPLSFVKWDCDGDRDNVFYETCNGNFCVPIRYGE